MSEALETIKENQRLRDEAAAKVEKKVEVKQKVSLAFRLKCVEKLAERWPHNPMAMNYKAMGITDEELK